MDYLNLLVDTRKEFSIYLINDLSIELNKGINSLYHNCKTKSNDNNEILIFFQKILADVPKWNTTILTLETERIKKSIPYIEDLLSSVFISNMRLLCSIKNKNKQINIKIPKLENFIHKCYIQIAKEFWSYTYFFSENHNKLEIQKNKRQIECIIKLSIEEVIRKSLPIKSILKDYLETNLETTTESEISNNLIDITKETKKNNTISNDNKECSDKQLSDKQLSDKQLSDKLTMLEDEKYNIENDDFNINEELFLNTINTNIIDQPNELFKAENIKLVNIENTNN
jgi:hypothetical protein